VAELDDIARTVNAVLTELKLHDERAKFAAENLTATQERISAAVEKIAAATLAIKALTDHLETREEAGLRGSANGVNGFKLTPQIAGWLLGGGFLLGVVLKGGAEAASLVTALLKIKP